MKTTPKFVVAFLLGLFSFVLFMFLAETIRVVPENSPSALFINGGILVVVMAAYFSICEYFLSRRNPQATWKDWPLILALTLPLVLAAVISLVVEPNKGAALQAVGIAVLGGVFSCVGAALAAREARHKLQ